MLSIFTFECVFLLVRLQKNVELREHSGDEIEFEPSDSEQWDSDSEQVLISFTSRFIPRRRSFNRSTIRPDTNRIYCHYGNFNIGLWAIDEQIFVMVTACTGYHLSNLRDIILYVCAHRAIQAFSTIKKAVQNKSVFPSEKSLCCSECLSVSFRKPTMEEKATTRATIRWRNATSRSARMMTAATARSFHMTLLVFLELHRLLLAYYNGSVVLARIFEGLIVRRFRLSKKMRQMKWTAAATTYYQKRFANLWINLVSEFINLF